MFFFKRTLVLTLVFTLVSGHFPTTKQVYAAPHDVPESNDPFDDNQKKFNAFANAVENGQLANAPVQQFDVFHLAGQRVEYYLNGTASQIINLDDLRVNATPIAYTRIKVLFKEDTKEIVIEAIRGENSRGENGTVVARQFIPQMDIIALAQDNEIVSMIDRQGRLHAMDMGYISEQLFKSPIPVFQNLWGPIASINLSGKKVEANYLTRGTKPVEDKEIQSSQIFPQTSEGKPIYKAGDLLVTVDSKVYGLFARQVTTERIVRGSILLQYLAALVSADPNELSKVRTVVKQLEDFNAVVEAQMAQETMPASIREALVSIGHEQIGTLESRVQNNTEAAARNYDKFNSDEWKTSYKKFEQKFTIAVANAEKEKARLPVLQEDWQSFVSPTQPTTPNIKAEKRSFLSRSLDKFQVLRTPRVLGAIFSGIGLAYLGLPYAIDAGVVDQVKALMWIHDHAYPPVLKDAEYRTTLLLSMGSLMALWPLAVIISNMSGKALDLMSKAVHSSKTKVAGVIRDLQKNWGPLDNWQRITSFGMRLYSHLIYPYFKVLIKTVFRQKSFFSAMENGLNPFERVSADSELGRMMEIQKSQFVGLNNPFLTNGKLNSVREEKSKLQGSKIEIEKRRQSLAWLLAAIVVSEDSKIDVATLLAVGPSGVSAAQLEELLSSEKKIQEWYSLTHMINKQLNSLSLKEIMADLNQLSKEDVAKFYGIAKNTAAKLHSMSGSRKKLLELSERFKRMSLASTLWITNWGEKDANFLRKVYTDKFVTGQVKQEFATDHAMVVGVYGLYGERADLTHPSQLSASRDGLLWTSGPHLYDVGLNTFIHFFVSGSRMALLFQGVKAKKELRYLPIEDFEYVPETRTQPLLSTSKDWIKDIINPVKADIGGVMIRRLVKSLTTIQASITLNLVLRYGLTHQTLAQSMSAWILMYAAQQWYFGWIWDPIQQGNKLQGERFATMEAQMKTIRVEISQGIREGGENGNRLRDVGAEKMRALYLQYSPKTLELVENQKGSALNAQEILNLSVLSSPVYTQPHPFLTWFTTWTGAVVSTALSIPLAVMTFEPHALEPAHIGLWVLASAGLYTASYLALAKKPWEFYLKKIDQFKANRTSKKSCKTILEDINKKD